MILLDEPRVLRILLEAEPPLQIHEWLDYNPEGRDALVLKLLDRIYELLLAHPVERLLVKTERARGAFSPEVQEFIREVQFPRMFGKTSLRFVATVRSPDQMARLGTELWQGHLHPHTLTRRDFDNESDARHWLQTVAYAGEHAW